MVWGLRIGILLLVGGTALGLLIAEVVLRFPRSTSGVFPASYSLPWEEVEILTPDGIPLRGWWMLSDKAKGTVIVCHGHGGDKGDALPFAQFLHRAGFHVLAIDLRGHGQSGGRTGSLGFHEVGDLRTVIDWLSINGEIPGGKLGIFGYSMGGAIAVLVAAEDARIRAVVADSAFADGRETVTRWLRYQLPLPRFPVIWSAIHWAEWRLGCEYASVSPENRIGQISSRPILLIHGENDRLIPADDSKRLFEAAGNPKDLWIVPQIGHVGAYDADEETYIRRVTEFFERAFASENSLTPESNG